MEVDQLRQQIADFLRVTIGTGPARVTVDSVVEEDGYTRHRITYLGREGEPVPAFLLVPEGAGPFPAVLVHHQHAGQHHLGKSEVCGLAGDPWQAFGPALAGRGFVVLSPDAICFEDRRRGVTGIEQHEADATQHYDEMCRRLIAGDTLIRQVVEDSVVAVSVLRHHPQVDPDRVGILGHSMGGSTVLFHMALDDRIAFACSSGAASSYRHLTANRVGIEMSRVIPDIANRFDIEDLVKCAAPRPMLLASASGDKYSMDAGDIVRKAQSFYTAHGADGRLEHNRCEGDHSLTEERFNAIVDWIATASAQP